MIHLAAIVGRGLSQAESKALGVNLPRLFPALRNSKDLRDHVSLGAACGVSAAVGAGRGCGIRQLQTLSVVFQSFRLISRRAIISRSGFDA